jgi:hypothetical protein
MSTDRWNRLVRARPDDQLSDEDRQDSRAMRDVQRWAEMQQLSEAPKQRPRQQTNQIQAAVSGTREDKSMSTNDQKTMASEFAAMHWSTKERLARSEPQRFADLRAAWHAEGRPTATVEIPVWGQLSSRERAHMLQHHPARAEALRTEWYAANCPTPGNGPEAA